MQTLDRLPVPQLLNRYTISRASFYQRTKALDIKFEQKGRNSYANAEQIDLLDQYDQAIARGEGNEFIKSLGQSQPGKYEITPMGPSELKPLEPAQNTVHLIMQMAQEIAQHLPTKNLLEPQRSLQEAADHGWVLSTRQLHQLIGIKPKGHSFERYGFVFERYGTKEWSISTRHK